MPTRGARECLRVADGGDQGNPLVKLEAGQAFPDLDLPDHTGRARRLSELAGGDPLALLFSRGWWCPKEQRHLREVTRLQDEFEVAYRGSSW